MTSFNLAPRIHLDRKAQIAFLLIEKIKILHKYWVFTDVFSEEKNLILLEHIKLSKHAIQPGRQ